MKHKNLILFREAKKPIVWDAFFKENGIKKPMVIFCHGYKGFKDWGAWDLGAEQFSEAGLFFVKFNFSHNGGTIDQPIDFLDLEAFKMNNYSIELNDLEDLITYLSSKNNPFSDDIDFEKISLIGHSRGGGIALIKTSEDTRISQLITWASVSDFGKRMGSEKELAEWKKEGVKYVLNGRTHQKMPHNYQFYEDFKANEARFHIESAVKKIDVPYLNIHAIDDPSVDYNEALQLNKWKKDGELISIPDSDHVFGAAHPWSEKTLPLKLELVVNETIKFIKSHHN